MSVISKLPVWQQNHINVCLEKNLFKNKRILEIGGETPEDVTSALEIECWYCIDPRIKEAYTSPSGKYKRLPVSVQDYTPDMDFDLIFATNSFEHITGLDKAVINMYSLLKTGGKISALLGPIWSCHKGHHIWYKDSSGKLITFNNISLPKWAHLLYSEEEIKEILLKEYNEEAAKRISHAIFHSNFLNRLFYDDYKFIVENSKFNILEFRDWHESIYPAADIQKILESKYNKQNFSTVSIKLLLEK